MMLPVAVSRSERYRPAFPDGKGFLVFSAP